jgi:CubicO group peptidase (beta-lactamase class C family)
MKSKNHLLFPHAHFFCALGIAIIVLCLPSIQAQTIPIAKGYGNAVYQGLPDGVFLRKWMVLGPLPVSDKPGEPGSDMLKNAFDKDPFTPGPVDKKKGIPPVNYAGKQYAWQYVESNSDTIQLNKILGDTNFVFCYALSEVILAEPRTVLIGLGSDDGVKMWINGKEVHSNSIDRSLTVDDDVFEVMLNKGSNQVLIKILNTRLDYGFTIRPVAGPAVTDLLLKASASGDFDNVKTLVKYVPDINSKDKAGLTAWQQATYKGRTEIADFLKEKGALASLDFPPLSSYIDNLFSGITGKRVPGAAVLVSKNGEILYSKGYGLADIGYGIPVSTVTKFRIGSITKQFIAAAILKLQEEGKISVQDKLSRFIPDFPRGDEVTIHHLLTHTSGIASFTNRPDFLKTATVTTTTAEMLDSIKTWKFDFNPGDQFRYNNSGYFILGALIEKITGKSYGEYLKETFFNPLGMKNTGVHASQLILENEATGYAINNGVFEKALNWDMSRAGGAGSLYSTVEDLYLWNEALFNGKVLKEASLNAAFTPVVLNNGKKPVEMIYGYGWAITDLRNLTFINHGGGLHGFLSHLTRQPEEKLTVTVLTNCTPAQENIGPDQVAYSIAEYLLWQKMGKQQSYSMDSSLSASDLKRYEGRYDYGNAMVLAVTAEGDKLFAQMTGQARFQIFPSGNDEFYWKVVEARIKFLENEAGIITGAIHYQGGQKLNVTKLPEIKTIQVDQTILERYTGKYQYEPNIILTITASEGRLFAQPGSENKVELFPVSETEFAAREMDAVVTFIPDAAGAFNMKLRVGSDERTISKIK